MASVIDALGLPPRASTLGRVKSGTPWDLIEGPVPRLLRSELNAAAAETTSSASTLMSIRGGKVEPHCIATPFAVPSWPDFHNTEDSL